MQKLNRCLFLGSKAVFEGSLEVAKNFKVYLPFWGPYIKISDQNFQNCGNIGDILKEVFS